MRTKNSPIALEGLPFIGTAAVLTATFFFLGWPWPAGIFAIVTFFIIYFFRNPQRKSVAEENAVLAPADGVVIYIGRAVEEHLKVETLKISIFMSVFNVHVNRAPLTGRVVDSFYIKGKFLDVRHERATFENEQAGLILENQRGIRIACVQVAGLIARRIVCYLRPGDSIGRGEVYGLIRFGSRLDVYLPVDTNLQVALGDITVAGETVLGVVT